MEDIIEKLKDYVQLKRKLHSNDDYCSDYEIGFNAGANDILDDLEEMFKLQG